MMVFKPRISRALPAELLPVTNFNFCDFLHSDDHFERPTRQGIHLPSSNLSNKINQPNSSVANPASVVTNLDPTSALSLKSRAWPGFSFQNALRTQASRAS